MTRKRKPWGYDSRGIPFSVGCLPVILFVAAIVAIVFLAPDLVRQCIGRSIGSAGEAVIVYAVIAVACSPLLLFGSTTEAALFLLLFCTVVALGLARVWKGRHQAYWDVIRAKENARRREKRRAAKKVTEETEA